MKQGMNIALHGGDHKVGVTMLSQCIAEHLAEHMEEKPVIDVALHGDFGGDYCNAAVASIEGMRSYLEQKVLNCREMLRDCKIEEQLYLLRGVSQPEQRRMYQPEISQYLMEQLRNEMAFVVADTGSEADNGLAVGALRAAEFRCLVLTQQESMVGHWEKNRNLYRRLGIDFQLILVNRYLPEAPYTKEYLAERLEFPADHILTVSDSPYGLQADGEKKSLLKYKDERFRQGIRQLCQRLAEYAGLDYPGERRRKWWKNSI